MHFICTVSNRFPENYEIGRHAGVWGVEERYERRIRRTSEGDLIVFVVSGEFRAIHRITSEVYRDDSVLWPPKDESVFPFRVRISEPLFQGRVPITQLVERISFMKSKEKWQGTLQGANGVFNDRLTDQDFALIRDALRPYRVERPVPQLVAERPIEQVSLHVFEEQLQAALSHLLAELGLVPAGQDDGAQVIQKYRDDSGFSLLAKDPTSRALVVVSMDAGQGGSGLILQILRQISGLRQWHQKEQNIRGVILTDRIRDDLHLVTKEIPNLSVRAYRMRFQLDPEPEADNGGVHAA